MFRLSSLLTLAVFATLFSSNVFALHRAKLNRTPLQPFDPSQAAIRLVQKYGVGAGSCSAIAKLTKELVSQTGLDSEMGADVVLSEGKNTLLKLTSEFRMVQCIMQRIAKYVASIRLREFPILCRCFDWDATTNRTFLFNFRVSNFYSLCLSFRS